MTTADEFFSYTQPEPNSGCLLWIGGMSNDGYGSGNWCGRMTRATRIAWELAYGAPPAPELKVCHRCDTPLCVRADHLFAGTQVDNMRDARRKGRKYAPGTAPNARLATLQVRLIRALLARGEAALQLAAAFGVHFCTIYSIRNGETWRDV